ncbi:hypothetical protein D4764_07G0008310 [Takifugu flavidus]|uniref:Uncharacterized protein n=1 Tax=Takifugu flavidus TaxID=433684 RepID=A0A5C6MSA6_9TELE|nr:hypothetical protein D4764_07G0008310 [Takifugu flavidus]
MRQSNVFLTEPQQLFTLHWHPSYQPGAGTPERIWTENGTVETFVSNRCVVVFAFAIANHGVCEEMSCLAEVRGESLPAVRRRFSGPIILPPLSRRYSSDHLREGRWASSLHGLPLDRLEVLYNRALAIYDKHSLKDHSWDMVDLHPSILYHLSGVGSRGQQPKKRSPDFPLPSYFFQLIPRRSQTSRET